MSKKTLVGRTALMEEAIKPLYDIEMVCVSIEDRLRENLKQGRHYCDYIFHNGTEAVQKKTAAEVAQTEAVQKKTAAEVAQRMTQEGYYCQIGWRETTPAGDERWFVRVSVDPPKPTAWQRFNRVLKACLKMPKKSR